MSGFVRFLGVSPPAGLECSGLSVYIRVHPWLIFASIKLLQMPVHIAQSEPHPRPDLQKLERTALHPGIHGAQADLAMDGHLLLRQEGFGGERE